MCTFSSYHDRVHTVLVTMKQYVCCHMIFTVEVRSTHGTTAEISHPCYRLVSLHLECGDNVNVKTNLAITSVKSKYFMITNYDCGGGKPVI